MVLLPLMFRGFDDRVEQSAPVPNVVPSVHQMPNWTVEQIASVFNQLVPTAPQIVSAGLDAQGYSPQQRRLQKTLEEKRPNPLPSVGAGPFAVVPSLIYESLYAIANSTGSMSIAASSPEISDYEDSALVGIGPMVI
jgi:hypothetical protein